MNLSLTFSGLTADQAMRLLALASDMRAVADQPGGEPLNATEIDITGVPWHADFHAADRSKTTKGIWKKRRGADLAAFTTYAAGFTPPPPEVLIPPRFPH